jgi:hypothetical protein
MRHGTCFRRRLAARRAGAVPHSAVAELGLVLDLAGGCFWQLGLSATLNR